MPESDVMFTRRYRQRRRTKQASGRSKSRAPQTTVLPPVVVTPSLTPKLTTSPRGGVIEGEEMNATTTMTMTMTMTKKMMMGKMMLKPTMISPRNAYLTPVFPPSLGGGGQRSSFLELPNNSLSDENGAEDASEHYRHQKRQKTREKYKQQQPQQQQPRRQSQPQPQPQQQQQQQPRRQSQPQQQQPRRQSQPQQQPQQQLQLRRHHERHETSRPRRSRRRSERDFHSLSEDEDTDSSSQSDGGYHGNGSHHVAHSRFELLEDRFLSPSPPPVPRLQVPKPQRPSLSELLRPSLSGSSSPHGDVSSVSSTSPRTRSEEPLVKFRRAVRLVVLLLRATDTSRERTQRRERQAATWSTLTDTLASSRRAYDTYGISFDPDEFKANREIQVTSEAKAILSMEPGQRSGQQLRQVLASLRQAVPEFSEFPITMQSSLARVGWYERFEAKRVIIRQGHLADNFYFILSGTAVVIVMDTDKHTGEQRARTAALLGRGKSFGELALMHKSRRSATVTCREDVELLALAREDFIDIFMHVERDREPEHVLFLRTLSVLQDWPLHKLPVDNPQVLLFTYVRRGVLLCRDSNSAEWIYVIKSGSCSVIKALQSAHAQEFKRPLCRLRQSADEMLSQSSPRLLLDTSLKLPQTPRLPLISSRDSNNRQDWIQNLREKAKKTRITLFTNRTPSQMESVAVEHLQTLDAILEKRHGDGQSGNSQTPEERPVSARSGSSQGETTPPSSRDLVFVQVLKLGPRDTYGLESSLFQSMKLTTSTSLVSDGAEVVMINRKFFLDHTSEELRKRIRSEIQPLPSEESLQAQLQDMANWKAYRNRMLHTTLSSLNVNGENRA